VDEKKWQTMEADVGMSGVDIEVLMTSYVEDNTSQGKDKIFDSASTVCICFHKEMFNPWLQRRKRLSRWWMAQVARLSVKSPRGGVNR